MSYNGSGTFSINSAGQPVITGTVISSTAFNALTADLATGLSTAITKDGQTTTTARVPFAQGVSSTLVTDATSATTGSIITAGGISCQKALFVGTTATVTGAVSLAGITATSLALGGATLGTNALAVTGTTQLNSALNYGGITLSNAVTGTGNMVLSASPTLTGTLTAAAANFSGTVALTGTGGMTLTNAQSAVTRIDVTNTSTNAAASAAFTLANSTNGGRLEMFSTGATPYGILQPGFVALYQNNYAAGGLALGAQNGPIIFSAASGGGLAEAMRLDTGGNLGIGMTPSNVLDITKNQNAGSNISILNSSAGASASASLRVSNGTNVAKLYQIGTGFTTSSVYLQDGTMVESAGAGGLTLHASGTNKIIFASDATERARFDASGNLLVGTTSAVTKLTVSGKGSFSTGVAVGTVSGSQAAYESNYQQAAILQYNFLPGYAAAIFAEVQTSTSSDHWFGITGNYGSSGSATMVLQACNQITSGTSGNFITSDASGILTFGQIIAGASAYSSNATKTEFMRLDGSGSLLVGTTDQDANVGGASGAVCWVFRAGYGIRSSINTDSHYWNRYATGTLHAFRYDGTDVGSISVGASSTGFNTSSDARLKTNVSDAAPASALIDAIQVRQFDWKVDNSHQRYGMVAQELLEVAPEAVSVPTDPEQMMGVDYSKLVPMLIKEVQSLRTRLAALENK